MLSKRILFLKNAFASSNVRSVRFASSMQFGDQNEKYVEINPLERNLILDKLNKSCITIYTKTECKYCQAALELLHSKKDVQV